MATMTKTLESFITIEESNRRLMLVVSILREKVTDEKFDFSRYINVERDPFFRHCGTQGCAIGHAAANPDFQVIGFALDCGEPLARVLDTDRPLHTRHASTSPYLYGLDAVSYVFGISGIEVRRLFVPVDYNRLPRVTNQLEENATRLEVADNIERFIRERTK